MLSGSKFWKLNVPDDGTLKKKIPNFPKLGCFQTQHSRNWICRVLRKMSVPKRNAVTGEWRGQCKGNEGLRGLCWSLNVIGVIK
jgi:hypothetical protein